MFVVAVVSSDGTFYKALFDPATGGECQQESTAKFMKGPEEE
jgi:hypothetical protein